MFKKSLLTVFVVSFISQAAFSQVIVRLSSAVKNTDESWAETRCNQLQKAIPETYSKLLCVPQNNLYTVLSINRSSFQTTRVIDLFENEDDTYFVRVVKNPGLVTQKMEKNWEVKDSAGVIDLLTKNLEKSDSELLASMQPETMIVKKTALISRDLPSKELPVAQFNLKDLGKMRINNKTALEFDFAFVQRPEYGLIPTSDRDMIYKISGNLHYIW